MATAVRERPILFSGEMVRAILDGRKTQTRRVIRPQPLLLADCFDRPGGWIWPPGSEPGEDGSRWPADATDASPVMADHCPHGQPEDHLWVREMWRMSGGPQSQFVVYRADETRNPLDGFWAEVQRYGTNWRPSIHMPRWASRITLEVTGVRVERLQDITEEEAEQEGSNGCSAESPCPISDLSKPFVCGFAQTWNSLNAKRGYPWQSNPWVWVVDFSRLNIR